MFVGLSCPRCGQPLKLPEERIGAQVRCPSCRERFAFEADAIADQPGGALSETRLYALRAAKVGRVARVSSRLRDRIADLLGLQGQIGKGPTEVSVLLSGLLGLALTLALYLAFQAFRTTLIEELFLTGLVPEAIVFLSSWSLVILIWKFLKIRRLQATLSFDILPREISPEITSDNAGRFRDHALGLPVDSSRNFLLNRVLRALDHVRSGRGNQEVTALLSSQAELDTMTVESSYTMLRAFVWAVPILGFIGTVLGIGQSVLGFSGSLDQAQDLAVIRESLGGVTSGLSLAFNTTLIALAASIVLMLPTHWLQKLEDDLLNSISDYCNEELLARLEEQRSEEVDATAELVRQTMAAALEHQSKALGAWGERLEGIGRSLTDDFAAGLTRVEQEAQEAWRSRAEQLGAALVAATAASRSELETLLRDVQQGGAALQQETAQRVEQTLARIAETGRESLREAQTGLARAVTAQEQVLGQLGSSQERQARSMADMLARVDATVSKVQEGLTGLHERHAQGLERLSRSLEESLRALSERSGESWGRVEQSLTERHRHQAELLEGSISGVHERAQQQLEQLLRRLQEGAAGLQQETAARCTDLLASIGDSGRSSVRDLQESLRGVAAGQESQQRLLADALTRTDSSVNELQKSLAALQQRHAEGLERVTRSLADSLAAVQERVDREARARYGELEETSAALRRGLGELEKRSAELTSQLGRLVPSLEQQTSRLSGQLAKQASEQVEALSRASQQISAELRTVAESLTRSAESQTGRMQESLAGMREVQADLVRTLPESLAAQRAALEAGREQCDRLADTQRRLAESLQSIRADETLSRTLSQLGGLAAALGRDIESLQKRVAETDAGRSGFRLPFFRRGEART